MKVKGKIAAFFSWIVCAAAGGMMGSVKQKGFKLSIGAGPQTGCSMCGMWGYKFKSKLSNIDWFVR